jgi:hypothetical protein
MAITMRKTSVLRTPAVKTVQIDGSFLPNGSSAVSTTYGFGFSVARTDVGVFRVTLDQPFTQFVRVFADISIDDVNAHDVIPSGLTVPTGSTRGYFDLTHVTAADVSTTDLAAADITASGALRRIHFSVVIAQGDIPGNGV